MSKVESEVAAVDLARQFLSAQEIEANELMGVYYVSGETLMLEIGQKRNSRYKVTFKGDSGFASVIVDAETGDSQLFYEL